MTHIIAVVRFVMRVNRSDEKNDVGILRVVIGFIVLIVGGHQIH